MMYARIGGNSKVLASPDLRASCPMCNQEVLPRSHSQNLNWHWEHEGPDCEPWAELETDWHMSWKGKLPPGNIEVTIERDAVKHRAEIVCANGAVLLLRDDCPLSEAIRHHEIFFTHAAWLFRVQWASDLRYGKRGFWWKHGQRSQTLIQKLLFWDFEEEGIVQQIKLKWAEETRRVIGKAARTYDRAKFATFVATGKMPT